MNKNNEIPEEDQEIDSTAEEESAVTEPISAEEELKERIEFYKGEQKKDTEEEPEPEQKPADPEPEEEPSAEPDESATEEQVPEKPKKSAQERINELVFQREEAKRENAELEAKFNELTKSVAEIKDSKSRQEKPDYDKDLSGLQKEHAAAMSNMDFEKASELNNQIYDVIIKRSDEKARATVTEAQQTQAKAEDDGAIEDFYKKNTWMQPTHKDYNEDKAAHAEGVYRLLSPGYKGKISELLKEVDARVNKVFKETRQKPQVPAIGGVNQTRTNIKPDEGLPILSGEQKSFAHRTYPNVSKREAEKIYAKNVKKYAKR